MSGESPTRPTRLLVMPPVEVAAARWPCMSSATAPTVPNFLSSSSGGLVMAAPSWSVTTRPVSRTRYNCWRRASVEKKKGSTISRPRSRAKASGPRAGHQHVGAVFEHGARGAHRVAHVAHAGNGAGRERGAVHHGRVELVRFFVREHRAIAGIEERAVFEHLD